MSWHEKVITTLPENSEEVLKLVETPLNAVLSLQISNLGFTCVTGAAGYFHAISEETKSIITKENKIEAYQLIKEYQENNNIEQLINNIKIIIESFKDELKEYNPLATLQETYMSYIYLIADNEEPADVAHNARTFQDIFKGVRHKVFWDYSDKKKDSEPSWNKVADIISIGNGSFKKQLIELQGKDNYYHSEFTVIMKKTKSVSKEEMKDLFEKYIEHCYSLITLLNLDLFKSSR